MKKFIKTVIIIIAVIAVAFVLTSFKQTNEGLKSGNEFPLNNLGSGIKAPPAETLGTVDDAWVLAPRYVEEDD